MQDMLGITKSHLAKTKKKYSVCMRLYRGWSMSQLNTTQLLGINLGTLWCVSQIPNYRDINPKPCSNVHVEQSSPMPCLLLHLSRHCLPIVWWPIAIVYQTIVGYQFVWKLLSVPLIMFQFLPSWTSQFGGISQSQTYFFWICLVHIPTQCGAPSCKLVCKPHWLYQ